MTAKRWFAPAVGLLAAALLALGDYSCPLLALTGFPCPGCGITRALSALLRLDFSAAARCNPMVFLLPPLAALFLFGIARGWSERRMTRLALGSALGWGVGWILLRSVPIG
ncbi:MAG: DUF2752 domain-containing protein [Oscillospiraceae bacterium]